MTRRSMLSISPDLQSNERKQPDLEREFPTIAERTLLPCHEQARATIRRLRNETIKAQRLSWSIKAQGCLQHAASRPCHQGGKHTENHSGILSAASRHRRASGCWTPFASQPMMSWRADARGRESQHAESCHKLNPTHILIPHSMQLERVGRHSCKLQRRAALPRIRSL